MGTRFVKVNELLMQLKKESVAPQLEITPVFHHNLPPGRRSSLNGLLSYSVNIKHPVVELFLFDMLGFAKFGFLIFAQHNEL